MLLCASFAKISKRVKHGIILKCLHVEFTNYLITWRFYDFFDATVAFLDPGKGDIDILPSVFVKFLTNFLHLLVSLVVIASGVLGGKLLFVQANVIFICRVCNHLYSTVCVRGFRFSGKPDGS